MAHSTRGFLVYTDDFSNNHSMKATTPTATFNAQTLTKFPVGVPWGYNYRDFRHVLGVDSAGKRARMTVCTPAKYESIVIGSTTFQDGKGNTYTVTSAIGEKNNAQDAR